MCFLWQHEIYLRYFSPGTACLYSGPSPVDLACLRNHLLHACRYRYCGCYPQDTAVERDRSHYSFSSIRAVVYGFSGNMRNKLVYDVLFSCLFVFFMRLVHINTSYFHAYSYDTYILVVRCMKQNKDAVWSLVLVLVTGVRADQKYSYSHDIILCTWYVRIVTFDFSLKYFIF